MHFFVAVLLSVLVHPTDPPRKITLEGVVHAADVDSLDVTVVHLMLASAKPEAHEHRRVRADSIALTIDVQGPVYLVVGDGARRLPPLLVEPGARLRLDAQGEEWPETARLMGPGSAGPSFVLRARPYTHWREARFEARRRLEAAGDSLDAAAFLAWVDSVRAARDAAVAAAATSPAYAVVQRAENAAMAAMIGTSVLRLTDDAAARDRLRARLLRRLTAVGGGDTLAYAMRYTEVLGDLLDETYRVGVRDSGGVPDASGYYHFRKAAVRAPGLRQVLLAEVLQSMMRTDDWDDAMAQLIDDFDRGVVDARYADYVDGLAAQRRTIAPGEPAPGFVVRTLSGGRLALSDLRGRVVLATVWGSWCSKSAAQLPWLEEVRERMADSDVVFLNLAYDEEHAWRDAIRDRGLGGINALTNEPMRRAYGIVQTPTFILIGRDGRVLTTEVPRPSEREGQSLERVLRAALRGQAVAAPQ